MVDDEKKSDGVGKWILAGFFAALGAFMFEMLKRAGTTLAEPTEDEE